jgi:host factor-I protein
MPDKSNNLQDIFLNNLRKNKTAVTMFLVKGVKLQGIITSTVMPGASMDLIGVAKSFEQGERKKQLQEVFLSAVQRTQNPVTMFLVNGVMLQGDIVAYDLFCMLLQRDGATQLVYKHAISTVQPANPLNLAEEGEEDVD